MTLVCPPGRKLLIVLPNYWGTGIDIVSAILEVKKRGGSFSNQPWQVYQVTPDTYLLDDGRIFVPTPPIPPILTGVDVRPILVAEFNPS